MQLPRSLPLSLLLHSLITILPPQYFSTLKLKKNPKTQCSFFSLFLFLYIPLLHIPFLSPHTPWASLAHSLPHYQYPYFPSSSSRFSMAFRKSIASRLFHRCKTFTQLSASHHAAAILPPSNASNTNLLRQHLASPFYGRLLNLRAVYHSGPSRLPEFLSLPLGHKLRERLRATIGINAHRLRLDGLAPPPATEKANVDSPSGITVNDARKILRLSRVEKLKAMLRQIPRTSISHSEYIQICVDACQNHEDGTELAKMLDDSGNVIVLGNVVFLRPQQVAETMESLIGKIIGLPNDPRRRELEEMEKQKAMIDEKAKALVRGELYCGLALLVVQTLAFIRLTFWELNWDVMEPICFFFTSFHFALAYLFFLKTSTEPSFQGYFLRRFTTKQQRLMNTYHFDARRYHELCSAFYPNHHHSVSKPPFFAPSFNRPEATIS